MISLGLDIAITDANFSGELGKTILVVFLMWRVLRILNGNLNTLKMTVRR